MAIISWRPLERSDLTSIDEIATRLHPTLPERYDVLKEKIELFPNGCKKLVYNNTIAGYGLSYPWNLYDIPSLDSFLVKIPDQPDCLYIHDVAVLPDARGHNATGLYLEQLIALAKQYNLCDLSLVSVYNTTGFWKKHGFAIANIEKNEYLKSYGETSTYMIYYL